LAFVHDPVSQGTAADLVFDRLFAKPRGIVLV
jgi:hypothetical protein